MWDVAPIHPIHPSINKCANVNVAPIHLLAPIEPTHPSEYDEAEAPAREGLSIRRNLVGERHWNTALALDVLAETLTGLGRYREAEPLYLQAIDTYEETLGADHHRTALCRQDYGLLLLKLGRYEDAEQKMLFGLQVLEEDRARQETIRHLIELYETWGKPEKAAEYRAMLLKEQSK